MNQKSIGGKDFANIDTLFSLPDAFMYSQLVTFKDANQDKFPQLKDKSYQQLYKDVRRSVDLCHRDGVIKDRVGEDPGLYIQSEPGIVDMLKRLKLSGRKVFLLTNSLWDYTNVVMNHICGNSKEEERNLGWMELFDLVRALQTLDSIGQSSWASHALVTAVFPHSDSRILGVSLYLLRLTCSALIDSPLTRKAFVPFR
jgi:hypothetical protein